MDHITSETNGQSKQWAKKGGSASKKVKTVLSADKVISSVFWDARGIIFIDYLQKVKKINSEYYANLSPVHTSVIAMARINELKFKLLPQAPYSPDSAPSDYFLIPNLKKWLWSKIFQQ